MLIGPVYGAFFIAYRDVGSRERMELVLDNGRNVYRFRLKRLLLVQEQKTGVMYRKYGMSRAQDAQERRCSRMNYQDS
jgi:hypothetical protein